MRKFIIAFLAVVFLAARADAQLPIHFSANAGIAKPFSNEKDLFGNGYHVGVGAKVALIPIQLDAAYDHMGFDDNSNANAQSDDLNITSVTASLALPITPPLLPVGAYLLAGGGLYHHPTKTDVGITAGAGVKVGAGLNVFAEARGHAVNREGNKITYATLAAGIRF